MGEIFGNEVEEVNKLFDNAKVIDEHGREIDLHDYFSDEVILAAFKSGNTLYVVSHPHDRY